MTNDDLILILDDDILLMLDDDGNGDDVLVDDIPFAQHYADYEGPYVVTPVLYDEQELFTNDKHMTEDVTIKEIPVIRTTNPSGGITVVIG